MPASREEDSWKTQENLALSRSLGRVSKSVVGEEGMQISAENGNPNAQV